MVNLTFGEQVKIILGRKGMTIKELAELVEKHTGKPMSRQNMTQRLGRDNFQEKDMRLIAEILGCKFQLSIMEMDAPAFAIAQEMDEQESLEREITIGELVDMADEVCEPVTEEVEIEEIIADEIIADEIVVDEIAAEEVIEEVSNEVSESAQSEAQPEFAVPVEEVKVSRESEERSLLRKGIKGYFRKPTQNVVQANSPEPKKEEKSPVVGDINPYTGKEYKTNSVRMHPKRIGYVQVYDQEQHKWTDMTEWAFLGYQERKKALLGKDYEPPIYLD